MAITKLSLHILRTALLLAAGSAIASEGLLLRTDHLNTNDFPAAAVAIRDQMTQSGGSFVSLSEAQKQRVESSLTQLDALLQRQNDGERVAVQVTSLQKSINEILLPATSSTRTATSDVVCRRERKMGSNIPETVCRSRQEMENDAHSADRTIKELSRGSRVFGGGGG